MEISTADLTTGFSTLVAALFGGVAKHFSSKITELDEKQQKLELSLASDFVKKTDLSKIEESVNEIKQAISMGTVEFREIKNSQAKIENRLESLCNCFSKAIGNNNG